MQTGLWNSFSCSLRLLGLGCIKIQVPGTLLYETRDFKDISVSRILHLAQTVGLLIHEYKGCTKDQAWLMCNGHYDACPSTVLFCSILFYSNLFCSILDRQTVSVSWGRGGVHFQCSNKKCLRNERLALKPKLLWAALFCSLTCFHFPK
jgi:hypothetical protein